MSIELVLTIVSEANFDECVSEISKFNYVSCENPYCSNLRSGNIGCFFHGDPLLCDAIRRDGSSCVRKVNDTGTKCGIHGGSSKKDILLINKFRKFCNRFGFVSSDELATNPVLFNYVKFCLYSKKITELGFISVVNCFKEISLPDKNCGICYTEDNLVEFSCCKQACCKYCSSKWVKTNKSCPFCRASV